MRLLPYPPIINFTLENQPPPKTGTLMQLKICRIPGWIRTIEVNPELTVGQVLKYHNLYPEKNETPRGNGRTLSLEEKVKGLSQISVVKMIEDIL